MKDNKYRIQAARPFATTRPEEEDLWVWWVFTENNGNGTEPLPIPKTWFCVTTGWMYDFLILTTSNPEARIRI